MKRLTLLILLIFLLCGCTADPSETTAPPQTDPISPTEPRGIYVPGSDLEVCTDGALRTYLPTESSVFDLEVVGQDVLVFSGSERTRITRLSGENLYPTATVELGCIMYPDHPSFQVGANGITYFDSVACALVFLDNDLQEVNRMSLSENLVGTPVLSSNRLKLYYCTADAVRVLDLETGLDRLLKEIRCYAQTVSGTVQNDTVIRCDLREADGSRSTVFISAETGEFLKEVPRYLDMTTGGGMYYVDLPEGELMTYLYGQGLLEADVRALTPADPFGEGWFLEDANALVSISRQVDGTTLEYYDLLSGRRTAALELPEQLFPLCIEGGSNGVYLLGYDSSLEQNVIYRWEPALSAITDNTDYRTPRYTLESPDTEGLTACAALAQELADQYGIDIIVGPEAALVQPWDYTLEPEYQVPMIRRELEKLQDALARFPSGFFETLGLNVKLCLVRSITGTAESGSVTAATGAQFWQDDIAYVAVNAGDSLGYAIWHELFHVIDTRVLSNTTCYYDWERLNPPDFAYDQDYIANQDRDGTQYLEEETRAFIDTYSMSFPKEDRARVFEYACNDGNEHFFHSPIMQAKLRTLCLGIREAFGLEKYPEVFLWEQYLTEPLAPKN